MGKDYFNKHTNQSIKKYITRKKRRKKKERKSFIYNMRIMYSKKERNGGCSVWRSRKRPIERRVKTRRDVLLISFPNCRTNPDETTELFVQHKEKKNENIRDNM